MEKVYNFEADSLSGIFGYETLSELQDAIHKEAEAENSDNKWLSIAVIIIGFANPTIEGLSTGILFAVNSLIDDSVQSPSTLAKYLNKLDEKTLKTLSTRAMMYTADQYK